MEKGLSDSLTVLENWVSQVFSVLANTLLLPLRFLGALLQ